jgi:hypothetical protein
VVPVTAGVVWTLALLVAVATSSLATVVVMAPVGVLATVTAGRAASRRLRRPGLGASAAAALVAPAAALAGPAEAIAALAGAAVVVALVVLGPGRPGSEHPGRVAVALLGPTVAVTSVVVARHQGVTLALILVVAVLAYDAGAFLMGDAQRATGGWVGIVFGAASVAVTGIFAAALVDPPFGGVRPVVAFAGVALLAPVGVWMGQFASGGVRLPAARRLDSFFVSAPFWVVLTALLLHR